MGRIVGFERWAVDCSRTAPYWLEGVRFGLKLCGWSKKLAAKWG